jgi:hypothetical protein
MKKQIETKIDENLDELGKLGKWWVEINDNSTVQGELLYTKNKIENITLANVPIIDQIKWMNYVTNWYKVDVWTKITHKFNTWKHGTGNSHAWQTKVETYWDIKEIVWPDTKWGTYYYKEIEYSFWENAILHYNVFNYPWRAYSETHHSFSEEYINLNGVWLDTT